MTMLLCRIGWAEKYEIGAKLEGEMEFVKDNETGFEEYDFKIANDGYFYGYFPVREGNRLATRKLGGDDDHAEGVTLVFCARKPGADNQCVVGWYENATIYSKGQDRPQTPHRKGCFRATSLIAIQLPPDTRTLQVPHWGQINYLFIDGHEKLASLRSEIYQLINGSESRPIEPETSTDESKRLSRHFKIERSGQRSKLVKELKGYKCEACGFQAESTADLGINELRKAALEAHHLAPLADLKLNSTRKLDLVKDFAVLCANCHRMIHKTDDVSDIENLKYIIGESCKNCGGS